MDVAALDKRLKQRVRDEGGFSLDKFEAFMQELDSDGNGRLDREELYQGLRHFGLEVTKAEADMYFDHASSKLGERGVYVDVSKFVASLVPGLNKMRKRLVKKAYHQLDANKDGTVSVEELKRSSCVRCLPHVKAGLVSEVDEMKRLLDAMHGKDNLDFESFRAYVEHRISMFVGDDDQFGEIIAEVWNVPFIPPHMQEQCIKIVRERIVHNSGDRNPKRETKHVFKKIDKDKSGELSMAEFREAMKSMSVWLADPMLRGLFEYYDADGSGFVSYDEFVDGLFPEGA